VEIPRRQHPQSPRNKTTLVEPGGIKSPSTIWGAYASSRQSQHEEGKLPILFSFAGTKEMHGTRCRGEVMTEEELLKEKAKTEGARVSYEFMKKYRHEYDASERSAKLLGDGLKERGLRKFF
jgi:hypothetical protein